MDKKTCECKWCSTRSALVYKINNLLTEDSEKIHFDEVIGDLMHAETDAIYWKQKYYGTWPSDSVQDIQVHISILEKRITELKNEQKNSH